MSTIEKLQSNIDNKINEEDIKINIEVPQTDVKSLEEPWRPPFLKTINKFIPTAKNPIKNMYKIFNSKFILGICVKYQIVTESIFRKLLIFSDCLLKSLFPSNLLK